MFTGGIGMTGIYARKNAEPTVEELAHKKVSRALAGECMVLLENDGVLPLEGIKKIALYGNGARATVKGGTGSGDVNTRDNVTIEDGLLNAGYEIASKEWLDRYDAKRAAAKKEYGEWICAEAK